MAGRLRHQPCAIVRQLLVAKGVGSDPSLKQSWPVFESGSPDKPDSAITVYDSTGILQGRIQYNGETQLRHGLQFMIRAAGTTAGGAKAQELADLLDKQVEWNTVSIGNNRYIVQSIGRTSDVLALGKEPGTQRSLFSINATATLRQVA